MVICFFLTQLPIFSSKSPQLPAIVSFYFVMRPRSPTHRFPLLPLPALPASSLIISHLAPTYGTILIFYHTYLPLGVPTSFSFLQPSQRLHLQQ